MFNQNSLNLEMDGIGVRACRICAYTASPTIRLIDIFSDEGIRQNLRLKLFHCLKICITKTDLLPTTICELCLLRIQTYFHLLQDCCRGQKYFTDSYLLEKIDSQIMKSSHKDAQGDRLSETSSSCDLLKCDLIEESLKQPSTSVTLTRVAKTDDKSESNSSNGSQTSENSTNNCEQGVKKAPAKGKLYVCAHCGKKLNHRGDFNKHLRKHTGEQPYECDICAKKFAHTSNLKRHKLVHSGELPFQCQKCLKRFNRKDKLTSHKRCVPPK